MYEKFKLHLQGQGLAALSVSVYLHAVELYFDLYRDVDLSSLLDFRQHLITTYKPQTANLYIIGINKYLIFIGMEQWHLKTLRLQQRTFVENVLSNEQYERLKTIHNQPRYQKWYFIIWTLASTGVRVSELIQFRVEHVKKGYLDICSKGSKLRRIYIPSVLQQALWEWCQAEKRSEGYLFVNLHGSPISKRGIAKGLERAASRGGVNPKLVHPHAFRHLFAKNFLNHRNDISLLADLLGHESLETTKIYLRYSMQEQREMVDQLVDW